MRNKKDLFIRGVGLLLLAIALTLLVSLVAADTPDGQPLHHVLGDGVADTPLEMHELYKQQDGGADGQLPRPNE